MASCQGWGSFHLGRDHSPTNGDTCWGFLTLAWCFMKLTDYSWYFIMLSDAMWSFLKLPDSSKCFSTYNDSSWPFLRLPDTSWGFLTFPDSSLLVLSLPDAPWGFLELPVAFWLLLTPPDQFCVVFCTVVPQHKNNNKQINKILWLSVPRRNSKISTVKSTVSWKLCLLRDDKKQC